MKYFWYIAIVPFFILLWGAGAGECGYSDLFRLLSGQDVPESARTILLEIRLPRLLAAFLTGGMLAASGAAAQNLFRNDLASPHVLGVIYAAALGAVFGMFLPIPSVIFSFLFAIFALLLIFLPGRRLAWDSAALLLAGVAVNAFAASLTSGVLYLADERLSSIVFWMLGGFWRAGWNDVILLSCSFAAGICLLSAFSTEMDMLLLGDRGAALSGVPLKKVKPIVLTAIALMTASCVSCCGVIGFIGLAVPHIVRSFSGSKFSSVLPASILVGGIFLLLADLLARMIYVPHEIPVGILTSAFGGPFFFILLLRRRKHHD
ncbi:MAG: iron ABC transporter permease [Lentisphaerae bacterium]|nr:iron ABC transporter permease [Lentisphaerota bacterium]